MDAHAPHGGVDRGMLAMRILLVEDARSVVQVMTARLSSYGYEVLHAENGQRAIEVFQESSPDLVLMDIEMPVMNGFEATNGIRAAEALQQWAWTPIIFLTSSDTVQNLVTAIEAGGDDFMSKFVPEPVLRAKMLAMSRIATLRQSLSVANRKLQDLANQDGLTGLCNRRCMDIRVDAAWAQAQASGGTFGLMMIDIDNFKKYNDHYGHQAGDDCLRQVAQALEGAAQAANAAGWTRGAFAARYGGEEFALVMPQLAPETFDTVADSIVNAVRLLAIPHAHNMDWGIVTISAGGVCLAQVAGTAVVRLFSEADARLYRAKAQGRNGAVLGD